MVTKLRTINKNTFARFLMVVCAAFLLALSIQTVIKVMTENNSRIRQANLGPLVDSRYSTSQNYTSSLAYICRELLDIAQQESSNPQGFGEWLKSSQYWDELSASYNGVSIRQAITDKDLVEKYYRTYLVEHYGFLTFSLFSGELNPDYQITFYRGGEVLDTLESSSVDLEEFIKTDPGGHVITYRNNSFSTYGNSVISAESLKDYVERYYYYYDQNYASLYDDNMRVSFTLYVPGTFLTEMNDQWTTSRAQLQDVMVQVVFLVVPSILLLVWAAFGTGRKQPAGSDVHPAWIDWVWTDVALAVIAGVIVLGIVIEAASIGLLDWRYGYEDVGFRKFPTVLFLFMIFCHTVLISLVFGLFLSLVRRLKSRSFIRNMLVFHILFFLFRIPRGIYRWFRNKGRLLRKAIQLQLAESVFKNYRIRKTILFRHWVTAGAIVIICFFSILFVNIFWSWAHLLVAVPLCIALLVWHTLFLLRVSNEMEQLCGQVKVISSGNLTYQAEIEQDSLLYETSQDLNHIGDGLHKSMEAQIKGERMKVDLITNVSHDLKTPLTSIISYVDLLDKEELSDEAKDYVRILAQKSASLKNIVSDLFDLAKTTSGTMSLKVEPLDLSKLVIQTLSDMDDRVEKSGRIVRKQIADPPVPIMGDGQKLYRVFQNLTDNALKYSLEGTRIFIDLTVDEQVARFVIKNTASYEMDFTEDEIMERFVRGDKSRSTEGNGLGLSIAQGFVNACGGTLTVAIDGDLFKCTVTFPILVQQEDKPTESVKGLDPTRLTQPAVLSAWRFGITQEQNRSKRAGKRQKHQEIANGNVDDLQEEIRSSKLQSRTDKTVTDDGENELI